MLIVFTGDQGHRFLWTTKDTADLKSWLSMMLDP